MPTTLRQNVIITCIAILVGVALCTLGFNPANEPIDSIAVIWPGALLHSVGAILLGGWGVVATVISAMIVDIIKVGTVHAVIGYAIPDFFQAFIPAFYYRRLVKKHGWGNHTFRFLPYLFFAVLIPNIVGAILGTLIFNAGATNFEALFFPFLRWMTANVPIALFLGWPLFRCLGPTMAEEGLAVNGWWK